MVIDADLADLIELLQFPFMQRALLEEYCWAYYVAASRFCASFPSSVIPLVMPPLLGLSGVLLNLDPTLTLLPFTVLFGLVWSI